jgi:tryprostatin B 6-hydroxylase
MNVQAKTDGDSNAPQDIIHTLIEHYQSQPDEAARRVQLPMLQGDSRLIIVAGSDTTAATLVHLFYHLAAEEGLVGRLREELETLLGKDSTGKIDHLKIQDAPLLNGAINETLRLNPPVPSGVVSKPSEGRVHTDFEKYRKTPPEGVEIGGTYIPGDTVIQMPQYAMGHGRLALPNIEPT